VDERVPLDRHPEGGHVREVGLAQLTGDVLLREIDLLGGPFQSPPDFDAALQGAQLAIGEAAWLLELQVLKQGLRLQTCIRFEHLLELWPHLLKGIRTGTPGMLGLHLAGEPPCIAVLARRLFIHARLGGGNAKRFFGLDQFHQSPHLRVSGHLASRNYKGLDHDNHQRDNSGILIVVRREI